AKSVVPNRRSRRQPPTPVSAIETPLVARVRGVKPKRQSVPEYSLNALDAAVRVLREAKKPLTCQEIVDRAIKRKYWRSSGATPANTLNAALATEIKSKKENARFVKVGRGLFAAR
ncbi:MAG: winged helix-turn-helix domain-containing protein, partial [Planctomycetaceae bacterium]|nr:winged helix-turn-helix domain-containing protein [Planctomycetaceae bacterium]